MRKHGPTLLFVLGAFVGIVGLLRADYPALGMGCALAAVGALAPRLDWFESKLLGLKGGFRAIDPEDVAAQVERSAQGEFDGKEIQQLLVETGRLMEGSQILVASDEESTEPQRLDEVSEQVVGLLAEGIVRARLESDEMEGIGQP